jgi:pimeloyl-ACP methyl ester carboxylesterase
VNAALGVPTRISFSLSPGGTSGACLTATDDGPLHIERWTFDGLTATSELVPDFTGSLNTQLLALDDGTVLLSRTRAGVAEVWRFAPGEQPYRIAALDAFGVSLQPVPPGGEPLVAISYAQGGRSTVWRVRARASLEQICALPSLVVGGTWLDPASGVLAVDVHRDGAAKAFALDLGAGILTSLLNVTPTSNDRVLAASPVSGLMLVSTDAVGGEHIGWVRLGWGEAARFPATLHRHGEALRPVCVDPTGTYVLVHGERGARSHLAVYHPVDEVLREVEAPAGRLAGSARWAPGFIRLAFSAPTRPTTVATAVPDEPGPGARVVSVPADPGGPWAAAHMEELAGAAGGVESIVYGGPDWRTAPVVVVALHGGPRAAWRFDFDPVFQRFAAAGMAVVAPNQRGSTGYGPAHTDAINAAWGGPDLDDILRVGEDIGAVRRARGLPPPALFGASYGAYLGLLAACCGPELWSCCVSLAPFTWARRLYEDGSAAVRELIDMYDARTDVDDSRGPRDLLRLCDQLTVPLLLAHGEHDEVIPVAHARALAARLRELGRREGRDFTYVEVPRAGHDLTVAAGDCGFVDRVTRFLGGDGRLSGTEGR